MAHGLLKLWWATRWYGQLSTLRRARCDPSLSPPRLVSLLLRAFVELPVRWILVLSLLIALIGSWACRVDVAAGPTPRPTPVWVRTAHGWEQPDTWGIQPSTEPRLHPAVVAAIQACGSIFSLLAFPAVGCRQTA